VQVTLASLIRKDIQEIHPTALTFLQLRQQALSLAFAVKQGASDCEALADFADLAAIGTTRDQFVNNFGLFVPSNDVSVQNANNLGFHIAGVTTPVILLPAGTGSSGYAPMFQEKLDPVNIDQTHHFAAYFELGYSAGYEIAVGAAIQHDISPLNTGDIFLGMAAANIGAAVRGGEVRPSDVGSLIRKLCK
jgi:hypothetical protein